MHCEQLRLSGDAAGLAAELRALGLAAQADAIAEAREKGYLGPKPFGKDYPLDVHLYRGRGNELLDLGAVRDDDHVLAVFRRGTHWGAIAKSNYSGLRFREPVYRSLRELVMSYFEHYYNLQQ